MHEKNAVLTISGRSMVGSCLKIEMISQAYIMVNWLYVKIICSFVCVIRAVICSQANFLLGYFCNLSFFNLMINVNMPLIQIFFYSDFTFYNVFTQSHFFSQNNIYYVPFFTVVDLDNSDLYVGIWLKKCSIGGKTCHRVLFLAAACFSAKFFYIFRNFPEIKKS